VGSGDEKRDKRFYAIIAAAVIILIILTVIFSSNNITSAYIDVSTLTGDEWSEDINEKYREDKLFGLEKLRSFKYELNNNSYPAYVTVTTIKTLFMMNEKELSDMTAKTVTEETKQLNISINSSSKISGNRVLENHHRSSYIIYNGTDNSKSKPEKIKIFAESWNCAQSGSSVICIGFAQVTDNAHNKSSELLDHWATIIKDKDGTFVDLYGSQIFKDENGLFFNVICH